MEDNQKPVIIKSKNSRARYLLFLFLILILFGTIYVSKNINLLKRKTIPTPQPSATPFFSKPPISFKKSEAIVTRIDKTSVSIKEQGEIKTYQLSPTIHVQAQTLDSSPVNISINDIKVNQKISYLLDKNTNQIILITIVK